MIQAKTSLWKRARWYILGLLLFFGPFALYPRLLQWVLGIHDVADVHSLCLRMPIGFILVGKVAIHGLVSVSFITFALLLVSAFFFGPVFCGRLCPVGAMPEYLSRLIPDKWKIDWSKLVNPTPVRYGFFAAFLISMFVGSSLGCAFCNFAFGQRLFEGGFWGQFGVMGSTTILTAFLWLVFFGLFTKGGRGYCNFMCPVGALQNLIHSIGAKFGFTFKLRYDQDKCKNCGICQKECPMGALRTTEDGLDYKLHNCLTCRHCEAVCPKGALSYGQGDSGWKEKHDESTSQGTGIEV